MSTTIPAQSGETPAVNTVEGMGGASKYLDAALKLHPPCGLGGKVEERMERRTSQQSISSETKNNQVVIVRIIFIEGANFSVAIPPVSPAGHSVLQILY